MDYKKKYLKYKHKYLELKQQQGTRLFSNSFGIRKEGLLRPSDGTRLFSNSFGIRKEGLLSPLEGGSFLATAYKTYSNTLNKMTETQKRAIPAVDSATKPILDITGKIGTKVQETIHAAQDKLGMHHDHELKPVYPPSSAIDTTIHLYNNAKKRINTVQPILLNSLQDKLKSINIVDTGLLKLIRTTINYIPNIENHIKTTFSINNLTISKVASLVLDNGITPINELLKLFEELNGDSANIEFFAKFFILFTDHTLLFKNEIIKQIISFSVQTKSELISNNSKIIKILLDKLSQENKIKFKNLFNIQPYNANEMDKLPIDNTLNGKLNEIITGYRATNLITMNLPIDAKLNALQVDSVDPVPVEGHSSPPELENKRVQTTAS
jgi:hypothetical protein